MDGKPLWSKDLGAFPGEWGTAASPVIVGDHVIQNCDAAGEGLLMAFDKKTGAEAWKAPRTAVNGPRWIISSSCQSPPKGLLNRMN